MRDFIASQNSERLRQRLTGAIRVREPAAFARLARSLFEMALVTGIIARLYRMMVLSQATTPSNAAIALGLGALFLGLIVKWVRFVILRKEHAAWSEGTVRAGIPGEGFIERRTNRTENFDPLLFGERRKHDK